MPSSEPTPRIGKSLRVRLDACEPHGELTYFEGSPLDGIGVEVGSDRGVHPAQIWLWSYEAGRRIGPFVEPFFNATHSTIIEARRYGIEANDPEGNEPAWLIDEQRLNGLAARLDDSYLQSMDEVIDGLATGNCISWHKTGSVKSVDTVLLHPVEAGLLEVRQYGSYADQTFPLHGPKAIRVQLTVGQDRPNVRTTKVPLWDPNATFPLFESLPRDHVGFFTGSCRVGLTSAGDIDLFELGRVEFFAFLEDLDLDLEPIDWLPTSLPDLVERGFSNRLHLKMASKELAMIIDAFGGFGAPSHVTDLELTTYHLDLAEIASLLAMPQLEKVAVVEMVTPDRVRGVEQMCIDLKKNRPGITVFFDRVEIT